MANLIYVKIDVTKILKEHLFTGKQRDDGSAPKYLDCVLIPSPDSKYGDTHFVVQSLPKELREQGKKGPIIGNAKEQPPRGECRNKERRSAPPVARNDDDSDPPF